MKITIRRTILWTWIFLFFFCLAKETAFSQTASGPDSSAIASPVASPAAPEATAPAASVAAALPPVPVEFQLNDSLVKDKVLGSVGVNIALSETGDFLVTGQTDAAGKFSTTLAPGKYFVCYKKTGYIPLANSPIEVAADRPNLVTVTLSMLMEEVGLATSTRIQIILNWGSQPEHVKDADSHLICPCDKPGRYVWFNGKNHRPDGHSADLDVDDVDWGGPETITLIDPPAGDYRYWIHNYSGGENLGKSEAVVRVIIGDAVAGEYWVPSNVTSTIWLPFKAITVDGTNPPQIRPFSPEEIAAQAHLIRPLVPEDQPRPAPPSSPSSGSTPSRADDSDSGFGFLIVAMVIWLLVRLLRATGKKGGE